MKSAPARTVRKESPGLFSLMAIGVTLASVPLLGYAQANSEDDVSNGQSDLAAPGTYSGGAPTSTSDVTFTPGVAYSPATFTVGSNVTFGTLNDKPATALTVNGPGSITLSGGTNSVAPNAAELLFVAGGGSLTLNVPIVLTTTAANGNFDIAGTAAISGVISGAGAGFTKRGTGTLTLSGANTYSDATIINGGILRLDFSAPGAPAANIVNSASNLVLGGGTLNLTGNAGTTNSQTFNGATFNAGGSAITLNANASSNPLVLNLGAITRSPGATVIFTLPTGAQSASNGVTTTTGNTNGILGPWAAVNTAGAYNYATISGGSVVAYTAPNTASTGGATWAGMPSTGTGADGTSNWDITVGGTFGTSGAARSVNTIRYTGAGAARQNSNSTSVGGVSIMTLNGLMNTGTGTFTIGGDPGTNVPPATNGRLNLTIGASRELVLAPMTAGIVLNGAIANNGAGASGVTVVGNSTVTLAGTSTYTGATNIDGGTLLLSGTGAVNGSSGITINGPGAKFVQASSVAVTPAITVTQGTLDGAGTVGNVTIGSGSGGIIANGNGGTGTLTLASLTFSGAATVNAGFAGNSTPFAVTGALTTSGVNGLVTVNAGNTAGFSNGATYDLIGYGSFSGAAADFTKGTISGLSSRQSATLGNDAVNKFITLTIAGDNPVWTGRDSSSWQTGATGDNSNWKLQTAGTPTNYIEGDNVVFDDSALGSTAVNISAASVSPSSTTFNNSAKNYTVSSIGGFGIADSGVFIKNGSGTVTLTTANTYTGPTTIAAGTLQLGDGTTDGSINQSANIVDNGSLVYDRSTGSSFTYGNVISGTGALTMTGAGTQTLSAANTYAGATTVSGGTLKAGIAAALPTGTALTISGGTVDVNNFAQTVASLSDGGLSAGTLTNSGATTTAVTFNGTATTTFSGAISGALALSKIGTGGLTLSGANSYTGGTTLSNNGGILAIANASAFGPGAVQVNTNANSGVQGTSGTVQLTFATPGSGAGSSAVNPNVIANNFGFASQSLLSANGLADIENVSGFSRITGSLTINNVGGSGANFKSDAGNLDLAGSLTATQTGNRNFYFAGAGNGTISGVISNGAATVSTLKEDAGAWTFTGTAANTYTGATTVSAGTLALSKGADATNSTGITAVSGALAVLGSSNSSVASATEGVLQLAGNNQVADTSAVTLNGGTINTQAFSEGVADSGSGPTAGMGTLALVSTNGTFSFLDYGTGGAVNGVGSTLAFANSTATLGTGQMEVVNYEYNSTPGTASSLDHLFIGADTTNTPLTASQLAQITFVNPTGLSGSFSAAQLGDGEIIPGQLAPTPEPGGLVPLIIGIAGTGVLVARRHRLATKAQGEAAAELAAA